MPLSRRSVLAAFAGVVPAFLLASRKVRAVGRPAPRIDLLTAGNFPFDPAPLVAAGTTAVVLDLPGGERDRLAALESLAELQTLLRDETTGFYPVLKAADLERAVAAKRLGVILASQDASILGPSMLSVNDQNLDQLHVFHGLGLRVLQLTHNDRNALGDGYLEPSNAGLSRLGHAVVSRMNSLGMLIDLSHCGERTTLEAIAASSRPCAVTHTGCFTLLPSTRNKSDDVLRAVAARGGVIGIFAMSYWLTRKPMATLADVLDHIGHAVKVAGVEHVAFGSDYDPAGTRRDPAASLKGFSNFVARNTSTCCSWPAAHVAIGELTGPDRMARLADGLKTRGLKSAEVDLICGENFTRVLRAAIG